jgi:hypothetical protein
MSQAIKPDYTEEVQIDGARETIELVTNRSQGQAASEINGPGYHLTGHKALNCNTLARVCDTIMLSQKQKTRHREFIHGAQREVNTSKYTVVFFWYVYSLHFLS